MAATLKNGDCIVLYRIPIKKATGRAVFDEIFRKGRKFLQGTAYCYESGAPIRRKFLPNILTPVSLWNNFDSTLDIFPVTVEEHEADGVRIERVNFYGRQTEDGRVRIAAAFASDAEAPAQETVIIFPDSNATIDEEVLKFFVGHGYSALMVDYRGQWADCHFYTQYPDSVSYANTVSCGRHKDYVDESADKTVWYEWVGVGIYARKYVAERTQSSKIAVVGIRDGGEIAWKLAVAEKFSCVVPVCAAGWRAYAGLSKYSSAEPELDEERYRFIAGIDSQAYAPYVNCPVLMLCATKDARFDYDRAPDTFSRINPEYIKDSAITYSVKCGAAIGVKSAADMFMYLDKNLKNRQVFIPKAAVVNVEVDEDSNLVAKVTFDDQGIVESCRAYLAEDVTDSSVREWNECAFKRKVSDLVWEYYLNLYEKTSTVFILCYVKYINGFTVWSKMAVKKISGKFRNAQSRCRVMYNNKDGVNGLFVADPASCAIGGIFLPQSAVKPQLVTKAKGISGAYSPYGLATYRMNNPRYAPARGNTLSIDAFCDRAAELTLTLCDIGTGEEYVCAVGIVGGVWQSVLLESGSFKTADGVSLAEFSGGMKLVIGCPVPYAVNNIMWL